MSMSRLLSRIDHGLNGAILVLSLAIGSISTYLTTVSFHVPVLLTAIAAFTTAVWLILRLLPFQLVLKCVADFVVKGFFVVVSIIYMVKSPKTSFPLALTVLASIQIVIIIVTLGLEVVICLSCDSNLESGSETSTKHSLDEINKEELNYGEDVLNYGGKDVNDSDGTYREPYNYENGLNYGNELNYGQDLNYGGKDVKDVYGHGNWMTVEPKTVSYSQSVPNIKHPDPNSEAKHPEAKHPITHNEAIKHPDSHNQAKYKSVETLIPSSSETSLPHAKSTPDLAKHPNPQLNKLGSTPNMAKHPDPKLQRWKSINDEKVFLRNINESLLPSVLKRGESRILALKRSQADLAQGLDRPVDQGLEGHHQDQKPWAQHQDINKAMALEMGPRALEMGPQDQDLPPGKRSDSISSFNLPYISEFDDGPGPGSSYHQHGPSGTSDLFKDFDQPAYESDIAEFKIPQAMNQWVPSSNHISLNEWTQNAVGYQNARARSGANYGPGFREPTDDRADDIDHLSDILTPTLAPQEPELEPELQAGGKDVLNIRTPAVTHTNCDNNSDYDMPFDSSKVPQTGNTLGFSHLNRSFSAPSLQTFRNSVSTSDSHQESHAESHHDSHEIFRYTTPPPLEIPEPKTSPIKKLSPKKLFRHSTDADLADIAAGAAGAAAGAASQSADTHFRHLHHRHNSSMMSSQLSFYSTSSSPKRSLSRKSKLQKSSTWTLNGSPTKLSPKKSFKSFMGFASALEPKSHMISPPTLLKQAIVKKPLEEDRWDLHTTKSSNKSRVSSLPSAIIGEYDREKWNTMKELNI